MKISRMTRKGLPILAVVTAVVLFAGFCILTDSAGSYRRYLDADIPFVYQLNNSTPSNYFAAIERGHMQWNDVPSSYWEFSRGPNTPASTDGNDGINLVFFDVQGVNFPPGTSTIAYSRTWTSYAGGYHGIESDLVWNARDFPPSPEGAPGAQDLQSIIAHELGHHLGLGHQGTPGSPPGCGPTIQQATMYGTSSNGDTTRRHLHIHDIGGVTAIYPVWKLMGTVTDAVSSQPLTDIPIEYAGTSVVSVGPVETPNGTTYERPGEVFNTQPTDLLGQYSNFVLNQVFDVIVDAFAYERDSSRIQFNPPGGIGQTQTIVHNLQLVMTPMATISGVARNATTLAPVSARIEFFGIGDPTGLTMAVNTGSDGTFSANLHSKEAYHIVVRPEAPYVDTVDVPALYLPVSGVTRDFELLPAQVLLVDDDGGADYQLTYQSSMQRLQYRRRTFGVADSGTTPAAVLATFPVKPLLVWFTGLDSLTALTQAERLVMIDHLAGGGNLILTGQNIAQTTPVGDTLLSKTFGVEFNDNSSSVFLRGFAGDVIGDGINYLITGGPAPQTSKDILTVVGGNPGTTNKTLYYVAGSDTTNIAGIRVLGPNAQWGATYFGFGLGGFSAARQDTFIVRSIRFFDQTVVSVSEHETDPVPKEYDLAQNYPNPFNPTTQIQFGLPVESAVSLTIFDITGKQVVTLIEGTREAGNHTVTWNGRDKRNAGVATGLYFYTLKASGTDGRNFSSTKKMLLLK